MVYVLGMRMVFRQEDVKRRQREHEAVTHAAALEDDGRIGKRAALRRAALGFAVAALALLVAAPFLAGSAKEIADQTGVTATFIGTSLVAITTSLPELVTCVAAVRLGHSTWRWAISLGATHSTWRPSSLLTPHFARGRS